MSKLKNLDDSNIHYGIYARYIKRSLDFFLSLLALILLSPLFIILCILIRVKLGSPIFFKQARAGKDENTFEMIKFRTMTDARDENGELLPDTDRFTKFGDFLRNYSLDELPELINVLKGDMSLIGPRPLYTFYLPYYTEEEALRHVVRGGITGLAQVNGRALCRWKERFAYDVQYVKSVSLLNDIRILWQTIYKVFKKADIGIPSVTDEGGLHIIRDLQRPDRIKEIGSSFSSRINSEISNHNPTKLFGEKTVFLSTGRSCISEILRIIHVARKIAIVPPFTCESVINPFLDAGYEIVTYTVNLDLSIDYDTLRALIEQKKPTVFLFHRYFGFDTCEYLQELMKEYPEIITIEDETQYMFSKGEYSWATYRMGSIRKWGPLPDGAYLVCAKVTQPYEEDTQFIKIEVDAMNSKQAYLDNETASTNYFKMFAEGRAYIDKQKKTYGMSGISKKVIADIDIDWFKNARRMNAEVLIMGLKDRSWFDIP